MQGIPIKKSEVKECQGCDHLFKSDEYEDHVFCELLITVSTYRGERKEYAKSTMQKCPCRMCLLKRNCTETCDDFHNGWRSDTWPKPLFVKEGK